MNITSANHTNHNGTPVHDTSGYTKTSYIYFTTAAAVALGLCLVGLVGNVIVFWYLCFNIPRNTYTIYIINLSVADSIFIILSALLMMIHINTMVGTDRYFKGIISVYLFIEIFYDCTQYSGMYILTAISLERCISVLAPFWHQSNRPQNLSTIISIAIWVFSCLESLFGNFMCTLDTFSLQTPQCTGIQIMTFVLAVGICLPLMVISSLTLLIKIKRTFKQEYPPKLYIIIIIAVFVFILSVIPLNVLWFLVYFKKMPTDLQILSLFFASEFCILLNCTINPLIYFIVGKKWKQKSSHSIQDALQRAFRVEEEENEESKRNEANNT